MTISLLNFGQIAQATDESLVKKYGDKSKDALKKYLSLKVPMK